MTNHIYIMQGKGTNAYKIGRTTNVMQRLGTLQTGSPVALALVGAYSVNNAVEVETFLHYKLRQYTLHLEWFELPGHVLQNLQQSLTKLQTPCDCSVCIPMDMFSELEQISNQPDMLAVPNNGATTGDRTELEGVALGKTNEELLPGSFFENLKTFDPESKLYKNYAYYSKRNSG